MATYDYIIKDINVFKTQNISKPKQVLREEYLLFLRTIREDMGIYYLRTIPETIADRISVLDIYGNCIAYIDIYGEATYYINPELYNTSKENMGR